MNSSYMQNFMQFTFMFHNLLGFFATFVAPPLNLGSVFQSRIVPGFMREQLQRSARMGRTGLVGIKWNSNWRNKLPLWPN